jgi:hypothetical protein
MDKPKLSPRPLHPYETTLLTTLLEQDRPVTQFALVAWHLDPDGTPEDAIAGIEALEGLARDGYVCLDDERAWVDEAQRLAVKLQVAELEDVSIALLYTLARDGRPRRAGQVAWDVVAAFPVFASRLTPHERLVALEKNLAYVVSIRLRQLCTAGYAQFDGREYSMDAGQRAVFRNRFPGLFGGAPRAAASPQAAAAAPARTGRAVELE